MDEVVGLMGNVTRMLAIFGGTVPAVTVCFAGLQFMTGQGDPQKMAQARMSLIGTILGLVLVGVAFMIPRVVSETVIEPSGGIPVDLETGNNCDEFLRRQLVTQNWASNPARMNSIISQIQSSREECHLELWKPQVLAVAQALGPRFCFTSTGTRTRTVGVIGGQTVPPGLRDGGVSSGPVRSISGRDAHNNLIVYWNFTNVAATNRVPSDNSKCWLYIARNASWSEGY